MRFVPWKICSVSLSLSEKKFALLTPTRRTSRQDKTSFSSEYRCLFLLLAFISHSLSFPPPIFFVDWCHLTCLGCLPVCLECEHIPQNADLFVSRQCQNDLLNSAPPDTRCLMCCYPNIK